MNIYQHITLNNEAQELLNSCLPTDSNLIINNPDIPEEEQFNRFSDSEIAFGNIPVGWLVKSSTLKWIQLESVGYESYISYLTEYHQKVMITNLDGFFGQQVAESALAGILSLKRGMDRLTILKERKGWQGSKLRPQLTTLQSAKVIIAGGGNIGQSFKKIISGFDTDTVIYDKYTPCADITSLDEFDKQLSEADIVFCCLPETKETINLFNKERLSLFSPSALFVNVGRGSIVDEQALIRKLKEHKIAGAVLDVTRDEPLPEENELWDCPNLILTQHTGGGSNNELKGKVKIFLENLRLYLSGKTLNRIINI